MSRTRREFLGAGAVAAAGIGGLVRAADRPIKDDISLAAWSINRSFFIGKKWKLLDLPRIAREEFEITGLELVNQFFENPVLNYLRQLKQNAAKSGVTFVLIMVDGEGDMAAQEKPERMTAAVAHRKWVDIAHFLGCHAIRCNLGGPRQNWREDRDIVMRAAESFRNLLDYARGANLNVVIENHGGASSDPNTLPALMKEVNDPNFGVLPDFGNINPGGDHADLLRKLLPWAKGISVKASWAADGTHKNWDLEKMIQICVDAGYHGFWGIESSFGAEQYRRGGGPPVVPPPPPPPPEKIWDEEVKGIKLTKAVLEKVVLKK